MLRRLHDREEAGRLLARKLGKYASRGDVLVLGLPRGGVAVACEISRVLKAPLDVFLVRKLGVPGYEELAMGAISMGGLQIIYCNMAEEFHVSQAEIDRVVRAEQEELQRSEYVYRGARPFPDVRGSTLILVDDGIATGSTMRAAIAALRKLHPAHIVVAAGVAPLSTYLILRSEADEVVCLLTPREFYAVGLFYENFPQIADEDVRRYLELARNTDQAGVLVQRM
ncbi:MAG: phosphoribosyltransferase [Candidatus Acidiferrales bacterium]